MPARIPCEICGATITIGELMAAPTCRACQAEQHPATYGKYFGKIENVKDADE